MSNADKAQRLEVLRRLFPEGSFGADNDGQIIFYTNVVAGSPATDLEQWKMPYATVSWCADDVFNNLRLEMCPPAVLCKFLDKNEDAIQAAMIDAGVNAIRSLWRHGQLITKHDEENAE